MPSARAVTVTPVRVFATPDAAPVVILGVSRSGTTLLKEMLDRHPDLAIPSESYFISQLWDRHRAEVDADRFAADLGRLERIAAWGVDPADVRARLPARAPFHDAVQAIYACYAGARGCRRFGDKTPLYMQRLACVARAFPDARYVHIVRDGRDACLSFLAMRRRPRLNFSRPRGVAGFAAQWHMEITDARALGDSLPAGRYLELRYEDLVRDPRAHLQRVCAFLALDFDDEMLEYHRAVDPSLLADHPLLAGPPQPARSSWRQGLALADVRRFEAIAGDLLDDLGYPRAHPTPSALDRGLGLCARARQRVLVRLWWDAVAVIRRSPLWNARQAYVGYTAKPGRTPDRGTAAAR
jgi:sulfotransferase family protein